MTIDKYEVRCPAVMRKSGSDRKIAIYPYCFYIKDAVYRDYDLDKTKDYLRRLNLKIPEFREDYFDRCKHCSHYNE